MLVRRHGSYTSRVRVRQVSVTESTDNFLVIVRPLVYKYNELYIFYIIMYSSNGTCHVLKPVYIIMCIALNSA